MPIAIAAKSRQIILFVARVKSLLPETLSINILKKRKYLMILADSILNLWRFLKWERRLPTSQEKTGKRQHLVRRSACFGYLSIKAPLNRVL